MDRLKGFRDLRVYQLAYRLAMDVFTASKAFPREERFSLTDQVRRSSRGVAANIAEGFRKRKYPNLFVRSLINADGEAAETQVWLDLAHDCGFLGDDKHRVLVEAYEDIGRMLGSMMRQPDKSVPR